MSPFLIMRFPEKKILVVSLTARVVALAVTAHCRRSEPAEAPPKDIGLI